MGDGFDRRGIVLTPADFSADWAGWMAGSGLNLLSLHMLQRENDLPAFLETPEGRDATARAAASGIAVEYAIHSLSLLLPRDLFARRPDLFRMDVRGERVPDGNLCPSSGEALEILGSAAVRLAARMRPTTGRHHLWPDDGAGWCHCPRCAGLSDADQNALAMNAVLRALRGADPEARLACLSYLNTLAPPSRVAPDPGLFLQWAPIGRCYRHAVDDPGCAVNREHAAGLRRLLGVFDPEDAEVLEYWMDASLFSRWKRPPVRLPFDRAVVERDAAFYRSLGIRSVSSFGVFLDGEYVRLHGNPPVAEYGAVLRRPFARA